MLQVSKPYKSWVLQVHIGLYVDFVRLMQSRNLACYGDCWLTSTPGAALSALSPTSGTALSPRLHPLEEEWKRVEGERRIQRF